MNELIVYNQRMDNDTDLSNIGWTIYTEPVKLVSGKIVGYCSRLLKDGDILHMIVVPNKEQIQASETKLLKMSDEGNW